MTCNTKFPMARHQQIRELVAAYFASFKYTDTVRVGDPCCRIKAMPESVIDFAIRLKTGTSPVEVQKAAST